MRCEFTYLRYQRLHRTKTKSMQHNKESNFVQPSERFKTANCIKVQHSWQCDAFQLSNQTKKMQVVVPTNENRSMSRKPCLRKFKKQSHFRKAKIRMFRSSQRCRRFDISLTAFFQPPFPRKLLFFLFGSFKSSEVFVNHKIGDILKLHIFAPTFETHKIF